MPFFSAPERAHQKKLDQFRENFRFLISDGAYPPHRQQRLFQWCQKNDLDWNAARQYVAPEAVRFLRRVIRRVAADGRLTPEEIAQLLGLQRRLALTDEQATPIHELYDLVERKIDALLIERAAYLSSPALIDLLKREIAAYQLPAERTTRLYQSLERQHELAKLMAGMLPVVRPGVELYHDEVCNLDIVATYTPQDAPADAAIHGRLVATNERLMLLSPAGGLLIRWPQIHTILPTCDAVTILMLPRGPLQPEQRGHVQMLGSGTVFCDDPQYVATLLGAARRIYTTPPPEPLRPGRRLPT